MVSEGFKVFQRRSREFNARCRGISKGFRSIQRVFKKFKYCSNGFQISSRDFKGISGPFREFSLSFRVVAEVSKGFQECSKGFRVNLEILKEFQRWSRGVLGDSRSVTRVFNGFQGPRCVW